MVKELSKSEFESTIAAEMRLLDENDDTCADVPLLAYVEQCIGVLEMEIDADDMEMHYAYMNDEKGLCHVGMNFGDDQLYLVLVVDVVKKTVLGHCVLDFSLAQI